MLAQHGFSSIDGQAPIIHLLGPDPSRPHAMPALLAADIVDVHSRVAHAHFSVDGGEWLALHARGSRHEVLLSELSDGVHQVVMRAEDAWGNERISDPFPLSA